MSTVSHKHSVGFAREAQASCFEQGRSKRVGIVFMWSARTKCRHTYGREKVRWYAGRKQRAQGEPASDGGSFQEIVKMEVEEEVDIKNELDQRKKELQKQLRRITDFPVVPQDLQDVLNEKMQQELQDVEQRRNDLLPEHQGMRKKVAKVA